MIEAVKNTGINKFTPQYNKEGKAGQKTQPSFNGLGDVLLAGVQMCEKNPMLNVAVCDCTTAIFPRSIIEAKASNMFAGMEAFRRESSGLLINCILPGFVVMGVSALLQKFGMKGFNKANLSNCWASSESLDIIEKYMKTPDGKINTLENTLKKFLADVKGLDGSSLKNYNVAELEDGIKDIIASTKPVKNGAVSPKKLFNRGYDFIAGKTLATENLKLGDNEKFLSKNLKGYLNDIINIHGAATKEGIQNAEDLGKYISKIKKLVTGKSLLGLGLIIPLAISMQPINRWITEKRSGKKGAPIYKDFTEDTNNTELSPKEKKALLRQKLISVASMLAVSFLSMGCKLPSKKMLEFSGKFPTMDQARLISTFTFASRMMASEDKNELREATIRDIATFSSLYFLGDYAAKGIACLIEKFKPDIKLLNKKKVLDKNANILQKIKYWVKDVTLKSSDEVVGKASKNMRSWCQVGSIAFSLLALGIFIPLYTRTQTNKKREAELKEMAKSINSTNGFLKDQIKNSSPAFQSFLNQIQ